MWQQYHMTITVRTASMMILTAWLAPTTGLLASAASKLTALLVCAAVNYADPLPNRDIFLDYMLRPQVFM